MCLLPKLPRLLKLPRPQAKKNVGTTDVAEKLDVDVAPPHGSTSSKLQVRFSFKLVSYGV